MLQVEEKIPHTMDAIILAGGKGTRMLPLTQSTPKPLLSVRGRPILEWSLRTLRPSADRVIVVVKYLKEQIAAFMASQTIFDDYELVEQLPEPLGTGHALMCCQPALRSQEFLVMNGDDLFSASGIRQLASVELGILTLEKDDGSQFGVVVADDQGRVIRLHEKPAPGTCPPPVQVNIGAYKLSQTIFEYNLPLSPRGEYELTDYVSWLAARHTVYAVPCPFWLPIGTPADLRRAQDQPLEESLFGSG